MIQQNLQKKYQTIVRLLDDHFGRPQWHQHLPPVDELVSTILSQSTSDTNRDRGFQALKQRYPDWLAVMEAPEDEVIKTIRPAGLANQKGPRIQAALRTIQEERGTIELDFLNDMPVQEAAEWLTRLKGVGPKTAAIILLFTFNKPAFPVDTHVHRISKRLGLIGPRVSAEKAHDILPALGEPDSYYPLHINFIRLGRQICTARTPRCPRCPLQKECAYFQSQSVGIGTS
jgi:endonuclease-3